MLSEPAEQHRRKGLRTVEKQQACWRPRPRQWSQEGPRMAVRPQAGYYTFPNMGLPILR